MMNHGTNNLTHTLDFPLYGQLFASKFMAFGWQQDKRLIQIGHGVPVSCECGGIRAHKNTKCEKRCKERI